GPAGDGIAKRGSALPGTSGEGREGREARDFHSLLVDLAVPVVRGARVPDARRKRGLVEQAAGERDRVLRRVAAQHEPVERAATRSGASRAGFRDRPRAPPEGGRWIDSRSRRGG